MYSLQQMLLRALAAGTTSLLHNAYYDCPDSRFDIVFNGI